MKNTFGWMQLSSSDSQKAQDFYARLFNWSLPEKVMKEGENAYIEVDAGEGPCAGIAQGEDRDESHWKEPKLLFPLRI